MEPSNFVIFREYNVERSGIFAINYDLNKEYLPTLKELVDLPVLEESQYALLLDPILSYWDVRKITKILEPTFERPNLTILSGKIREDQWHHFKVMSEEERYGYLYKGKIENLFHCE